MEFLYFLIAIGASTIGAISGIGGGVIIKPVMDSIGTLSVSTVSFLSGCTVLAMALSNFFRNLKSDVKLDYKVSVYLALGASAGGILGKQLFSGIKGNVGLIQAVMLCAVNVLVLLYVLQKDKIKTWRVKNPGACTGIGLVLGFISAFLGIGGGPLNIAVLYYFFSMEPKETAKNSLFIILFSQLTSLATTFLTATVPEVSGYALALMCVGGVAGAMIGSAISKRIDDRKVERIFLILLIVLIAINVYNVIKAV